MKYVFTSGTYYDKSGKTYGKGAEIELTKEEADSPIFAGKVAPVVAQVEDPAPVDYASKTVAELKSIIEERGIDVPGNPKKEDLVAALQLDDESGDDGK